MKKRKKVLPPHRVKPSRPDPLNFRCPVHYCDAAPGVKCCDLRGLTKAACHGARARVGDFKTRKAWRRDGGTE